MNTKVLINLQQLMAGIYLHIPFCKQACYYCDFHFSTNQELRHELAKAMAKELYIQKDYLGSEVIETIYWGGGTPSLLHSQEMEMILEVIYKNYAVEKQIEMTLEANPDDLSLEKIKSLQSFGVNRLSIGIQSFDDQILQSLHRSHNSTMAFNCVKTAQDEGITNISIDLIFSIPGQSRKMLEENIAKSVSLNPKHISVYSLTVEEKTVFGNWARKGKFHEVENAESAAQFELVMDSLQAFGYEHYEISNYCLTGFESKHNSNYWKKKKYLGVGPSAHSYNGNSRQFNIANNPQYIKNLQLNKVPFTIEVLTQENKINEYILTSLRTHWGCDLNALKIEYAYDLMADAYDTFHDLINHQLIEKKESIIYLTRKGKLLADQVAADLFV